MDTTNDDIEMKIKELEEMFPNLPNPIHEPIRFKYHIKLLNYYKTFDQKNKQTNPSS